MRNFCVQASMHAPVTRISSLRRLPKLHLSPRVFALQLAPCMQLFTVNSYLRAFPAHQSCLPGINRNRQGRRSN